MCKILDSFVLVEINCKGISGGRGKKKDKELTKSVQSSTKDETAEVTYTRYYKGAFDSIVLPIKALQSWVAENTVASNGKARRFCPVRKINELRALEGLTQAKVAQEKDKLRHPGEWGRIVEQSKLARGYNVKPDDYPAVPPLDDWFGVTLSLHPHPKQSALSVALTQAEADLAAELEAEKAKGYSDQIEAVKEDLMGRVKDSIGEFVRKCVRLRSETRLCPNCGLQWEASKGDTCRRCGTVQNEINPKEERVFEATIQHVRDLASQLGTIIPEDILPQEKIEAVLRPVTRLNAEDLKMATENVIRIYEDEGVNAAETIASLIADTFA